MGFWYQANYRNKVNPEVKTVDEFGTANTKKNELNKEENKYKFVNHEEG
jgi:hypothetical protein